MDKKYTNKNHTPKKVVKKKISNSKKEVPKKVKSEHILLIVFVALLILVIILAGLVFSKKKEMDNKTKANLVIPVFEKNSSNNVSLNVKSLEKEKDYILKITNYKDKKINSENLIYKMTVENQSDAQIKITKGDSIQDLMKDQKKTIIENQNLGTGKKEDIYYHISIVKGNATKDTDIVNLKIES